MRNKSNAAAGLCDYVRNITVYWDINEDTEPKREKGAQAARDLEAAINAKQERTALAPSPHAKQEALALALAPSPHAVQEALRKKHACVT